MRQQVIRRIAENIYVIVIGNVDLLDAGKQCTDKNNRGNPFFPMALLKKQAGAFYHPCKCVTVLQAGPAAYTCFKVNL